MNFDELMKRRYDLTHGKLYTLPADRLEEFRRKIIKKCPGSKKLYGQARKLIPGGAQHMLVNKDPFPITVKTARGCKIKDVDDNEYIDYLMMAGPIILGHNHPQLIKAITRVINTEGIGTGWTSEYELKAVQMIKKFFPSVELFRYFQSGTEADMAAARVARVYTNKKKIAKIGGSYHGWADQFVYDMHVPYTGKLDAAGIPDECFAQIIAIPPNDVDALERAFRESRDAGGIAGVFVEPLGGESGAVPMHPGFPKALRELCDKYEALLIFDEVVTAFRLDLGGAQKFYKVKPDLTVFGKILTHGFPSSGGVGGRKEVMECLVSGLQPGKGHAFVGGTMGANPISAAAGYYALKLIEKTKAVQKAGTMGDRLTKGLNGIFQRLGFPFFAYNFKSIVHFETAGPVACDIREKDGIMNALTRKQAVDNLGMALLAEGVITKYGNRAFTSLAHTPKDIDRTLEAFERVLKLIPR